MMSSILNLKALNSAAITDSTVATAGDYKALVCLSMSGGNDSYNMLVPTSSNEYSAYSRVRSNLALRSSDLLSLNGSTDGRTFGLHPAMVNMRQMYNQGKAAFIANVGTMVEPLTVQEFWAESKKAPLGLLSHSDQLQQWQTAIPHDRTALGWGGRIADLINDTSPPYNLNDKISMNISLSGTNVFQSGLNSSLYSINPDNGPASFQGYDDFPLLKNAVDNLLDQQYDDVFKKTYLKGLRNSRDAFVSFNEAFSNVELETRFPSTPRELGESLNQVAKTIASSDELGFKRQTFFIDIGGFDTHDELLVSHTNLLQEIDVSLKSFQDSLIELGMEDQVVTFTISDFSRTLGSNGNGTDHAWGGHVFALGGPVNGGQIYGEYPQTLDLNDNALEVGGGIVLPTTSADLYFAELAHWFGVSKSNLELIFPNLINFYDYRSAGSQNPLNFLNIS